MKKQPHKKPPTSAILARGPWSGARRSRSSNIGPLMLRGRNDAVVRWIHTLLMTITSLMLLCAGSPTPLAVVAGPPAGAAAKALACFCTITPDSDTNPVGTSHIVTVTVTCNDGESVAGRSITLTVTSGPNVGVTRQGTTNSGGQVILTYPSNGIAGRDTLEATGPSLSGSCSATKTWQAMSPGADNRMPTYNLPIDPHVKPACGCPDGSRTSFTSPECPNCKGIGQYAGITEDTGGKTVYLHNGEFTHSVVDLEIPGRGFNWKFARTYRSGMNFNGPQGNGWEFNYNRRLFMMPGGMAMRMDGFARADAYMPRADGTFTAPTGFYTGLTRNPDGTFTEREPNGTKIQFSRPDSRGVAVMTQVADRNGNTMRFSYNAQNQLVRVLDTFGRAIDYRYNDQGRLIQVTDFVGRTIRFTYDANGDLVAATSPAVTGTPTRNDFPQGKTTRYTYSSGLSDETLNYNLLTIMAPNEVAAGGQPRIRVEYDTNRNSPNKDRVLRQTIGGTNAPAAYLNGQIQFRQDVRVPAGGTISYQYQSLRAAPPGDFTTPVSQTTITDRNGNLTEYQFNQLGNIVRIREFTSRKIRPGDPEFFETKYEYNKDGELTRMIYPEGNSIEYPYDASSRMRLQQGNLLTDTRRPDAKRGGDQSFIRTSYDYEPIYNQRRMVTDPRGNDPSYVPQNGGANQPGRYTTQSIFDYQEGSNLAGLARELGITEGEVRSLLQQANIPMGLGDVNGDGRTDQIAGNVVKVSYPTVNLLPDSNLARLEGNTRQPSDVVSQVYDERDLLFTTTRGGLTQQFRGLAAHADIPERNQIPNDADLSTFTRVYDLNRNLTQSIDAADNTGDGQPEATTYLHDGFDRWVSTIDAVGNQSFTILDPAGNRVRVSRFGPVGGLSPASNRAATFTQPLTLQSFRQPLLNQTENKYDEGSRVFERGDRLFDYRSQGVSYARAPQLTDGPLGSANDGVVVTRYEYDRKNRQTFLIQDDLDTTQTLYDGVDRVIEQIDPEENRVHYTYDDQNNVVQVVQQEMTQRKAVRQGKVPDLTETFTTINVYDALDRMIRATNNVGQTLRSHYDSRDNLIATSDAQSASNPADLIPDPLGLVASTVRINGPGNTTAYLYDGINRRVTEIRDLRRSGQGDQSLDMSNPANPDGRVMLQTTWDASSRMSSRVDDNGNATRFQYDDLNRLAREVFADGTTNIHTYDADSNRLQTMDENRSVIARQYDGINRPTGLSVTRGSGVIGTTQQSFQYDGLSRLVRAVDNNEPGDSTDDAVVTLAYDSLNRRLEEVQNGQAISSRWAGDNNRLGLVYPNGRELGFTFDQLDRINQINGRQSVISGQRVIADYDYIGPDRILERTYANGTRLTYLDDARQRDIGYDGIKRIVNLRHLRQDTLGKSGIMAPPSDAARTPFRSRLFEFRVRQISDLPNAVRISFGASPPVFGRSPKEEGIRLPESRRLSPHGKRNARTACVPHRAAQPRAISETHRAARPDSISETDRAAEPDSNSNNLGLLSLVAGFSYSYDRRNNKLSEQRLDQPGVTERYAYDSLYRLIQFTTSVGSPDTFQLDGVGNWVRRNTAANQVNVMNEYEQIGGIPQRHDDDGNVIDDGRNRYEYDALNSLRRVTHRSDNSVVAVYRYDAFNRRLERLVASSGALNERVLYYYDGWREIEERRGNSVQQYVYGMWVDEPLTLDKDDNNDGVVDQSFYYHQDGKTNVAALTNATGRILQTITYDAYGRPNLGQSPVANPYLFAGRRYDPETGLYYFRARFYDPLRGRFLQRDPIGMWTDKTNLGNGYTYVGNNPVTWTDPLGLLKSRYPKRICTTLCTEPGTWACCGVGGGDT